MKYIALELTQTVNDYFLKLSNLSEEDLRKKSSPKSWSLIEIVGHLIDSATNNHHRFIRIQESDPLVFPKYEQNLWVSTQNYSNSSIEIILNLWKFYNLHLADVIKNMDSKYLTRICKIGEYPPETLEFIMKDYLNHI